MSRSGEFDQLWRNLIEQWNIAERRIKAAEHVNGMEVVTSAIFELRYAGRKIIDSLDLMLVGESVDLEEHQQKIRQFLGDAIEDCVKAKHDAIDAMLLYVTLWIKEKEELIGLDQVTKYFPDYVEITTMIFDVQDKIAQSREDRKNLRDGIYNDLELSGEYKRILDLYRRMTLSEERIRAQVEKEERQRQEIFNLGLRQLASSDKSKFYTKSNFWVAVLAAVFAFIAILK